MGLDMYLSRKTFLWTEDREKVKITGVGIKFKKGAVSYITEEVGYWRKQNHIHRWFVTNCQSGVDDCREYYVEEEQLHELLNLCKEVLENHSKASDLLPVQQGFFFGSTAYDVWYFSGIEYTVKILTEIIEETDFKRQSIEYSSSW